MKKNWLEPEFAELDISDTFGGPSDPEVVDNFFFNDEKDLWERWRGNDS